MKKINKNKGITEQCNPENAAQISTLKAKPGRLFVHPTVISPFLVLSP
jgi:hypothetical protein